jgi:hypothetical protein
MQFFLPMLCQLGARPMQRRMKSLHWMLLAIANFNQQKRALTHDFRSLPNLWLEAIFGFLIEHQTYKERSIFSHTKHIFIGDDGYCIV